MTARTALELQRIADYEAGPDQGEKAFLGAIWRRDWELEAMEEERKLRGATICSGIGAPECALPGIDWIWSSEIEKFPSSVLAKHHPGSVNLGDFTAPDFLERAAAIGRPDVLVAENQVKLARAIPRHVSPRKTRFADCFRWNASGCRDFRTATLASRTPPQMARGTRRSAIAWRSR